ARVPGFFLRFVAFVACIAIGACSPAPIAMGTSPEILWWTDHEDWDFSGWSKGGADRGGIITSNEGKVDVATAYARSGRYAMRATVTSPGEPVASVGMAQRSGVLPKEAYYSAWYY